MGAICEDVSGFLNGDGGLILVGLDEGKRQLLPDIATGLSAGVPRSILSASRLESMVCDQIHPSVAGLVRVFPVGVGGTPDDPLLAYAIEIRSGITAYQAPDKKYYIRRGYSSHAMEDKDIRLRMLTHQVAKVTLNLVLRRGWFANSVGVGAVTCRMQFEVEIVNTGLRTVRQCNLSVKLQPQTPYLAKCLRAFDDSQMQTLDFHCQWPESSEIRGALHPDQQLSVLVGSMEIQREWDERELELVANVICYMEDAPSVTREVDLSEQLRLARCDLEAFGKAATLEELSTIRRAATGDSM